MKIHAHLGKKMKEVSRKKKRLRGNEELKIRYKDMIS